MTDITDIPKAKRQFERQRRGAFERGVGFELTFAQWCDIWEKSGKYPERGPRWNQYGMQRYWDEGSYRIGNVEIGRPTDNTRTWVNRRAYRRVGTPGNPRHRNEHLVFIESRPECQSPEDILIAEEAEFS